MISTLSKSALIQKKIDIQKFHRLSFSILVFCRREKLHAPSFSQQETRTRRSILKSKADINLKIPHKKLQTPSIWQCFDTFRLFSGSDRHPKAQQLFEVFDDYVWLDVFVLNIFLFSYSC